MLGAGEDGNAFPWSNAMLQWQRTGFHFQPQKNWMNDLNGKPTNPATALHSLFLV